MNTITLPHCKISRGQNIVEKFMSEAKSNLDVLSSTNDVFYRSPVKSDVDVVSPLGILRS